MDNGVFFWGGGAGILGRGMAICTQDIKIPTFFNTPLNYIQSMQGIVLSPSYWKPLRLLISIAFSAKPRYLVPACESELERREDLHQVGWQHAPLPCTWRVKHMRFKENLGRGDLQSLVISCQEVNFYHLPT